MRVGVEGLHAAVEADVEEDQGEHQEEFGVQPALAEEGGVLQDQEYAGRDHHGGAAVDDGAEEALFYAAQRLAGGRVGGMLGQQARDDEERAHPEDYAEDMEE